MSKEREASPWLIAERARCRLEGLRKATDLLRRYPIAEAIARMAALEQHYEGVMQNPQPTGIPGE